MLEEVITLVIIPFIVSMAVSVVFWWLTFKHSNIEIIFSDKLEKRKDIRVGKEGQYRYRVRISNVGKRDLFEVYMIAKLTVKTYDGRTNTTYFPVGEEGTIPVLVGKYNIKKKKENKKIYKKTGKWKRNNIYSYGLYINEIAYNEYSKNFYEESVRKKASNKTLVIDDIFQTYPDVSLTIFVFGNDSITGARRKYESKAYTNKNKDKDKDDKGPDIVEGRFHRFSGILWPKGRIFIRKKKEIELLKNEINKIDTPQKVLEKFLSFPIASSEEIFKLFSMESGTVVHREDDKRGFAYFKGSRADKVLLVAHADTVWDKRYMPDKDYWQSVRFTNGFYEGENPECGIGADDRAGCAMLYLLLSSGHSVLILDGEEHGQVGAHYLKDSYPDIFAELNEHQYIIQLDRRNAREYKCYNIPVSKEFREFIEKEFSYEDAGIKARTDIVVLCDKICGVNLSVGYYNEHTPQEKLCYEEWLHTYEVLATMLTKKQKRYLLE